MTLFVTSCKTCIIVLQQLLLVAIVILQLRQVPFDLADDEEYYPESYDSDPVQVQTQLVTNQVYQPVEKVLKRLVSFVSDHNSKV